MPGQDPLLTDIRQAPGWYAILPPPPPAKRLKGQQVADWVVVGAGVTGLAAARRLAELAPEARIILLDEYRVGYGASGRNSGFIIDTPHLTEQIGAESPTDASRGWSSPASLSSRASSAGTRSTASGRRGGT